LRVRGVAARREEKARLQFIVDNQALGIYTPPKMWIPIRDPQKNPTSDEKEALRANQGLYDTLATSQIEYEKLQSEDPALFTDIPIDPAILIEEQAFRVQHSGPLAAIQLDSEEDNVEDEGSGVDKETVSPPRSVVSIDSIAENADFVSFKDLRQ
jgi:hypothetical protein